MTLKKGDSVHLRSSTPVIVVLLVVILFVAAAMSCALIDGVGGPVRWEIPAGYRGWVVVNYESPSCPTLETDGIYLRIVVPASGHTCTADPYPTGWRYHRYEYVQADGSRVMLPSSGWDQAREIWPIAAGRYRSYFFVGTSAELEESWQSEPYERRPPEP